MISIIIATYNSAKTLQGCLDSIYKQTYKEYEILIKDGGSTDETQSILNKNSSQINYLDSSPDKGVYDAWNHCLKVMSGDWFIFLGSDDYFQDEDFLERIQPYLEKAILIDAKLVYGKNRIINAEGDYREIVGNDWPIAKIEIESVMTIRHPGCFHHKKLLTQVGLFSEKFKIVGDHHYILRALQFGEPMFYPFVGVVHALGGISTNPTMINKVIKESYQLRKDLMLKPYFVLNNHSLKRIIIAIIISLFGSKYGAKFVRFIISQKK